MSTLYRVLVRIEENDPEKESIIQEALEEEWPFSNWYSNDNELSACSEGSLGGGSLDRERIFARKCAQKVWTANEGYCAVTIEMTCLENLPAESYTFDEEDYDKLKKTEV